MKIFFEENAFDMLYAKYQPFCSDLIMSTGCREIHNKDLPVNSFLKARGLFLNNLDTHKAFAMEFVVNSCNLSVIDGRKLDWKDFVGSIISGQLKDLTHSGRDHFADILKFSFFKENVWMLIDEVSISACNGLVPNRQQVITGTRDDPGHWY